MTQPYDDDNVFARILRGEIPSYKLYEDAETYAFMDVMPQGKGHCLVITKSPYRNILDADQGKLAAVIATTQRVAQAVKKAFDADGVTVMQFNEPASGQTVFHLHFHVIPRFEGIQLRPHTGQMEDQGVLAANAEKIRQAMPGAS
ncbi:HIT family protein [Phyllobacterium lublinensis]|uniref:HIT family protein n=1 Tax=Phyllobacterium lublinensis TaxID=2875708 RepID=UPI001CCEA13B|nr:HIT family protein [Phyllobacterium sp. 2063]MBZ9654751.1 HIT family protein [Phyllobacterium sp. 2063]